MPIPLRNLCSIVLLVSLAALSGCANENAVFRRSMLGAGRPTVLTMDAKQRNVFVMPRLDYDLGDKEWNNKWKVCAEAAPDVFSALGTSAGADLGFGQSGASTDAKVKAALAISEAAGTIERTQTINLLRESMYRTCERYLSGAIDESTFVVQAGRDWKAMIAVLAIEQLTRSARPPSTVLIAGGTSTSLSSGTDIATELASARAKQRDAEDAQAKVKSDSQADCTKVAADAKEGCEAAKTKAVADLPAADLKAKRAGEDVADLQSVLKAGAVGDQVGAATTGGNPVAGGGGGSPSDIGAVAKVVETIALRILDADEMRLFCIQQLARDAAGKTSNLEKESSLSEQCLSLLAASAKFEANKLDTELIAFNTHVTDQSQLLRDYLVDDRQAPGKWTAAIVASGVTEPYPPSRKELLLAAPITLATATDRFKRVLTQGERDTLIGKIKEMK